MFSRMIRGKKGEPVILDAFIDHATCDKFVDYCKKKNLSESDALVDILERGMANYWLQEFKHLKLDYMHIEKLFTEFEKDNKILKALMQQNEQLRKIMMEKRPKSAEVKT